MRSWRIASVDVIFGGRFVAFGRIYSYVDRGFCRLHKKFTVRRISSIIQLVVRDLGRFFADYVTTGVLPRFGEANDPCKDLDLHINPLLLYAASESLSGAYALLN